MWWPSMPISKAELIRICVFTIVFAQVWELKRKQHAKSCEHCIWFVCPRHLIEIYRYNFFRLSISLLGHSRNYCVPAPPSPYISSTLLHPIHPYFQVRDMALASSIIIHSGGEFHFQIVAASFSRNASLKRSAPFCCFLPCLFLFTGQQWAGRRKRLKANNFQIKNYLRNFRNLQKLCCFNLSLQCVDFEIFNWRRKFVVLNLSGKRWHIPNSYPISHQLWGFRDC